MGINDLLKLYHPVIRNIHISEFKGQKCAVDMMVWLYRGVYASLNNESPTEKSDLYLNFPLTMLSLLKNNDDLVYQFPLIQICELNQIILLLIFLFH